MRKFLRCPRERGRQCDFFMTEEGPVRGDESQSFCQTSQTQRDSHSGDRIIGGQFRCGELAKEECCPVSTRLDGIGKQWPSGEADMQEAWTSHRDKQEDRREGDILCGDQSICEGLQQKVSETAIGDHAVSPPPTSMSNSSVTIPSGVRKRVLGELKKTICLLEQEAFEQHEVESHDISEKEVTSYLQERW